MSKKRNGTGRRLRIFLALIMAVSLLLCGCGGYLAKSSFREANDLFNQGKYQASIGRYEQILRKHPGSADRALFEMGFVYAYPSNENRDYLKALACFRKVLKEYPESGYRRDSEVMISNINSIALKDESIKLKQTNIDALRQEVVSKRSEIVAQQKIIAVLERELKARGNEIAALQKKAEALEFKIFAIRHGQADKILIEKKVRRMTLLSKGKVLKTYKIALGGNPDGPKERQGDGKTPEGIYVIDARNRDSGYHLALHISYPNEKDRKRARQLGVSPGGNIMIHGIKNNFSWIGDLHSNSDWTKGCIAVTDEEIEEIDKLVPIGTVVEIRP